MRPSRSRIDCKNWPVSCSDVISPRFKSPSNSVAVCSVRVMAATASFKDSGHAIELANALGCIGESFVGGQRRHRLVRAENVLNRQRMGERFNAVCVNFLELLNVIEYGTELTGNRL